MKASLFAEQNGFGLRRREYASRLRAHSIFSRHFYIVRGPKNISPDYQVSLPKTNVCLVNKILLDIAMLTTKQMSHSMSPLSVCQKLSVYYLFNNETICTQSYVDGGGGGVQARGSTCLCSSVDESFKRPPRFLLWKKVRLVGFLFGQLGGGSRSPAASLGKRIKLQKVCLRGTDLISRQVSPRSAGCNYK